MRESRTKTTPARGTDVLAIPAAPPERRKLAVAAYCRVSTDDPSQESSMENQRTHYRSYIESNPDWTPAGVYCEAGVSGTAAETRPELQRLIADCRAGRVDMVITKSVSRFSRNTADCLSIARLLRSLGVTLVFEKEHLRTDRMSSEFFLDVFAAFSQEESHSLSGNMKWAVRKRFRDGSYKGAKAPYGYRKTEESRYVVEPGEAAVVRRIFAGLAEGSSSEAIARELNAGHIPTWSAVRGLGDIPWSAGRIRQIARNRFYVGDTLCQKTYRDDSYRQRPNRGELDRYLMVNAHPAIIDRETFRKADAAIRRNAERYGAEKAGNKRTNRYPYSGRLFCGVCGGKMVRGGGERPFYICQKHARTAECPMKQVPEADIRSAFMSLLNRLAFALGCGLFPSSLAQLTPELERIHAALHENQRRWDALYDRILAETLTPALLQERAALEAEAQALMARGNGLAEADGIDLLRQRIHERGIRSPFDSEKDGDDELFRNLVEKAVLWRDEKLEVHFTCGLRLTESLRRESGSRRLPVNTRFAPPPAGSGTTAEGLFASIRPLPGKRD